MTSHLKRIGSILLALVASALTGSVAVAQGGQGALTSDGPVTVDMSVSGTTVFSTFGGKTECFGSTATGHKTKTTAETAEGPHTPIPFGSTSFTITGHFSNCVWTEGGVVHKLTAKTFGCDWTFRIGEEVAEDSYGLTMDIVCPQGNHMEWEIYPFANSELGGVECTITIKPQTGLAGPTLKVNTGSDDLSIEGTFSGIDVEWKKAPLCPTATGSGTWEFNTTVKGTNAIGKETGITVTD